MPARYNKKYVEDFKAVFKKLPEGKIKDIGKEKKPEKRAEMALAEIKELYSSKEQSVGEDAMRAVEREVYLQVLDTLWMQHLEDMQHLREGIHWRSVGQRDPLVEYRSESKRLFDSLQTSLREEVLKVLLNLQRQDVGKLSDDDYDTELTKMAGSATDKGVNEISSAKKNTDKEFKAAESARTSETSVKVMHSAGSPSKNKLAAKKKKKAQRKNRKRGRK